MAWDKKIHVASSMANDQNGYAMFLGRWQPLHEGHKQLFQQALSEGKKLLIMVRDTPVDEKNPFPAEEVKKIIIAHFSTEVGHGTIIVMIVPNITSINFGRGVGYDIVEYMPPDDIKAISATKIREEMKKDDGSAAINSDLPLLP